MEELGSGGRVDHVARLQKSVETVGHIKNNYIPNSDILFCATYGGWGWMGLKTGNKRKKEIKQRCLAD